MNSSKPKSVRTGSPQDRTSAILAGVVGSILIHPIAFAFAYAKGFCLGASQPMAPGPLSESGFTGGGYGLSELLFVYVISFGIVPIFVSAIGGVFGYGFGIRLASNRPAAIAAAAEQPLATCSIAWVTGVWASGLYIVNYCFLWVIPVSTWELPGSWLLLPFGIWGIGAVVAYFQHRSWQLSTSLVVIPFLLRILIWYVGFPREGVLLLSVLFLAYAGLPQLLRSNRFVVEPSANELSVGRKQIGAWTTVFLGGFTFYAAICLYCLIWAMSPGRSPEDWGPGIVLILGLWGIPIVGCVAAIVRAWTGPWLWLTPRAAWIAVCIEVSICALVWLAMLTQ